MIVILSEPGESKDLHKQFGCYFLDVFVCLSPLSGFESWG